MAKRKANVGFVRHLKGLLNDGVSLAQIAAQVNVSEVAVRAWVAGRCVPHDLLVKAVMGMRAP